MIRQRNGFTLAEVLLVIVMASLMLAMAAPKLGAARERYQVGAAKQQLAALLTTTRQAAIRRGTGAAFRRSGNRIWAMVPEANGTWTDIGARYYLDSLYRVTVASTRDTIAFDARGVPVGIPLGGAKFVVDHNGFRDSVCVSRGGLIMSQGCL